MKLDPNTILILKKQFEKQQPNKQMKSKFPASILILAIVFSPIVISCQEQKVEELTLPEPPQPQTVTSASNGSSSTLSTERDNYTQINLDQLPDEFALSGTDPKAIAHNIFGSKEPIEGKFQEEIVMETRNNNQVIVTITQLNLPDDSVRDLRYRIEFESEKNTANSLWQMVWAGRQQTCQVGRGSSDWTTETCS